MHLPVIKGVSFFPIREKRASLFESATKKGRPFFGLNHFPDKKMVLLLGSVIFFTKFEMGCSNLREFERVSARISVAFWLKLCACVAVPNQAR